MNVIDEKIQQAKEIAIKMGAVDENGDPDLDKCLEMLEKGAKT